MVENIIPTEESKEEIPELTRDEKIKSAKKQAMQDINYASGLTFNGRNIKQWGEHYQINLTPDMTHKDIMGHLLTCTIYLTDINQNLSMVQLATKIAISDMKARRGKRYEELKNGQKKTLELMDSILDKEFEIDAYKIGTHEFLSGFFERLQFQILGIKKMLESFLYAQVAELKNA